VLLRIHRVTIAARHHEQSSPDAGFRNRRRSSG
jgi:hypothetical protein